MAHTVFLWELPLLRISLMIRSPLERRLSVILIRDSVYDLFSFIDLAGTPMCCYYFLQLFQSVARGNTFNFRTISRLVDILVSFFFIIMIILDICVFQVQASSFAFGTPVGG